MHFFALDQLQPITSGTLPSTFLLSCVCRSSSIVVNPPQVVTSARMGLLKDHSTTTRIIFTTTAFKELLTKFTAAINRCGSALQIIYSRTNNSAQITTHRRKDDTEDATDKVSRVIITNGIPQSLRTRDNSSCT